MSAVAARPTMLSASHSAEVEHEQYVLSCSLHDAEGAVARAAAIVRPADFSDARHQLIYRAIILRRDRREPIDPLLVSQDLELAGELQAAGGRDYISYLLDFAPTAVNLEHYAKLVLDAARRSLLVARLEKDASTARSGQRSAIEIVDDE